MTVFTNVGMMPAKLTEKCLLSHTKHRSLLFKIAFLWEILVTVVHLDEKCPCLQLHSLTVPDPQNRVW